MKNNTIPISNPKIFALELVLKQRIMHDTSVAELNIFQTTVEELEKQM